MIKYQGAANFVAGAIFTLFLFSQFAFADNDPALQKNAPAPENRWTAPEMPEQLSFASENVPLERWDVKEKFDRELLLNYYSPGHILYLVKLANKNFPIISERLKAQGVPDDFKYLCIAESMMQSWAVSKVGAVGYWQFMPGTAPGYGLTVNEQVDMRRDLERSTDAAAQYLKQAYAKFGNWTAAAASYNCGMGGYNGQATFQRTKNYYDLHLPEETNKYIFRILAFKHLIGNHEALGYHVKDADKYQPEAYRTVRVNSSIPDLAKFAIDQGTNYKILRLMNPWIKGKSLSGGKSYVLKLPE
ncbi:MAG: lytic transglycosylase domain-containing protein [Flavisolibacter sp.]|nr:lytic transglycosylase domain-containing protein [Flavisolibacter sp.]